MADPRFFTNAGPFSLERIAAVAGAEVSGNTASSKMFNDVMPLSDAGLDDISFLDNRKYLPAFSVSRAGACIVSPELANRAPTGMALLLTADPYRAYASVAALFYPARMALGRISKAANIDPTAKIGSGTDIDAGTVIGAAAEIGDGCRIGANTVIADGVIIGDGAFIAASVTISNAIIGERAIVHPGVRIGQDGFGFALGPKGHAKVPQLGRVVIGDDVEIGANTTIDRGTGPDTVIGSGTKIDNLVQIAHNVRIGKCCVIVSHVGISGSTEIGDFVVLAGQVGVAGHLKIGTGSKVAAQSGVMRDIPPGANMGGSPAKPVKQWMREI
ncbi:MAG: UDP-3-O-(3-hydroxymyristoyl)glucosamine N-acyltransferase, partial [Proteobacteria bacterium]|nr:UDP-3-O-(3-hydroxymyristoyl)glucosamine N-acyltransferase [Pseudomonadota bacterium]